MRQSKLFIIVLLVILFTTIYASEAILKLDTKGHTASIRDIVVTKSGDIISAGYDKSIRVWDSETGIEKRKILGQIGNGSDGMIYAIALSSDERWLAVGGFFGNSSKSWGNIRIYNYQTGKILKVLKSHMDAILDLSFSQDGRYLISGSADKTAKIWKTIDFNLIDTINVHTKFVEATKIVKNNNNYYAVTVGYDNQISIYDIQTRKIIKSNKLDYRLQYLATTTKHIAVCGDAKEVLVYDYNLNLIKKIITKTVPAGLSYSDNEKLLIVGAETYPYDVNIYNVNINYSLKTSFKTHENLTQSVGFINNDLALSGGGNNNEIYIWDVKTGLVKRKIEGVGTRIWSVGIKGDNIGWGSKSRNVHDENSWTIQKVLNLKIKSITNTQQKDLNRISKRYKDYSLVHTGGGGFRYSDATLIIKKNQKEVVRIIRGSMDGYRHNCYGFYKNYIVSGGVSGVLKIYNLNGEDIASLLGHTGEIWDIAVYGDILVSGSDDQTLKVWNLNELKAYNGKVRINEVYVKMIMDKYNLSRENVLRQAKKINDQNIYLKQQIYPMLNIFVTKDNEYVIWSKSGYFSSSVGGDKYVGYHINQGSNKEAKYVSSDKYFDTFYRPDIIDYIWQTGSEKKAIVYAGRTKKVKELDILSSLPPVVTLLSSSDIKTSKNNIVINYILESTEPVTKILITLNGKIISKRALKLKNLNGNIKKVTIELEDGKNIISIKARNKFAFSDEVLINVYKTSKTKTIFKPTLYILSIGVSKYENSKYNLEVAHKDAKSIAKIFKMQEGKIYKKVVAKVLTDDKATSDNILDGLDWIDKESTNKDVVVIFVAGHGINDEKGNYYFMSYDANLNRLRRTAVKWVEIEDTISNLPSKVILLADTCHSGNITGHRRDITSAVKSIINSGSGSIIMTATTGSGYSYEQKDWGHGAFTKSILEGLGNFRADYDKDGVVTVKEIDLYITNRVKKLTDGKQKPTTIIPVSVPDFAVMAR